MTSAIAHRNEDVPASLKIESIGPEHIDQVAQLLYERNGTIPEYTHWKYGAPGTPARGVVAAMHGDLVGCFGLVLRELQLPDGSRIPSGWFADWYVAPRARGQALGALLLREFWRIGGPIFGHPGTIQAQAICRTNDYRPVGFQSHRRLVLRRWAYERERTHVPPKAIVRAIAGMRRSTRAHRSSTAVRDTMPMPVAAFVVAEGWASWIAAQPVAPGCSRSVGLWRHDDAIVTYAEDILHTSERRRLVLHTAGAGIERADVWQSFARDARVTGCTYVDCFTTNRMLDRVFGMLGAWSIPETDVLVTRLPATIGAVQLHGWDRENWTYLGGVHRGE